MSRRTQAARLRQQLSERDLAILTLLGERLRIMTGQQLRQTFFPEGNPITQGRKMRAAIQRLLELRLVVRLSRRVGGIHSGSDGQVVGLSGLGHAVLDIGNTTRRRHRSVSETKVSFQEHLLAISELHTRLLEQHRNGQAELIEFQAEPACWRRFAGIGGQLVTLKPDAFVRIGVGEYEVVSFIEQDMATEDLPTIARKLRVYVAYWHSGQEQRASGVFPRVWWLVPDMHRLDGIYREVGRLPTDAQRLFTVTLTHDAVHHLTTLPEEIGGEE